jgi:hypothetical protein
LGFRIGHDFLPYTVALGITDSRALVLSPNSRQKLMPRVEKPSKKYCNRVVRSQPQGRVRENLVLKSQRMLRPAGLWGPAKKTDSSVLVPSVRTAFPGLEDRTGQEPSLKSSWPGGPSPLLAASQVLVLHRAGQAVLNDCPSLTAPPIALCRWGLMS